METFSEHYDSMMAALREHMPGVDMDLVQKAVEYADAKHKHQKRKDGSPYIIHPLAVAQIAAEIGLDQDAILGALLHDCIEDTDASHDDISQIFGETVAELVEGVTKLTKANFTTTEQREMENLRKMFMAMSKDIRVVLIKIADRLHNMRTMQHQTPAKQIIKCRETMDIYAPLAHRLGMQRIKWELEDTSLRYLHPVEYEQITAHLAEHQVEDEAFMAAIQDRISLRLSQVGIANKVYGRIKHVYSIFRKMQAQNKSIDELYDIYAFRVVVDTIPDCYNVLGHIHDLFNLVPGRFKDYISTPKPNMYQSLHTTVIGKQGIPFEVQIRTWDMHEVAEYGVAAHWKYKQGVGGGTEKDFEWVRRLLESQQDTDAEDYIRSLKIDMFDDEVFVFTPKGRIVSLPAGSTPIDFAYAIHSGVGNSMVGAKVNNRIANIDMTLKNGDIVEVLTAKTAKGPSRDWLSICKSNQARTKIKQWFKKERREENVAHGRSSFEAEMRRAGLNLSITVDPEFSPYLLKKLSFGDWEDMYAAIGYGGLTAVKAVGRIRDDINKIMKGMPLDSSQATMPKISPNNPNLRSRAAVNGVVVEDIESCMVKFAKCCAPVPGDPIVGFITKGFGVSVHRCDCPNAANRTHPVHAARWVRCHWAQEENQPFDTILEVEAFAYNGLTVDVLNIIYGAKFPVREIAAKDNPLTERSILTVRFEVKSVADLENIRAKILALPDVISVRRGQN